MLNRLTIKEIIEKYPFVINFFEENGLNVENYGEKTFDDYLNHFTQEEIEEWGIDVENLKDGLAEYISQMIEFLGLKEEKSIDSITIIGELIRVETRNSLVNLPSTNPR